VEYEEAPVEGDGRTLGSFHVSLLGLFLSLSVSPSAILILTHLIQGDKHLAEGAVSA
jgi:hypothetical protein